MNRRSFIKIGIITNILVWSGLYVLDFKWAVKRMLLADIAQLHIEEKAVDRFLIEAEREMFWREFSFFKKLFISIQHAASSVGIRLPYYEKYIQYRNVITGHFLFSTDLFAGKHINGRKIKYLGFMNPYKTACTNPFSNLRRPV